jgi:hypothetical protein
VLPGESHLDWILVRVAGESSAIQRNANSFCGRDSADQRKSVQSFKGIFCHDISEFDAQPASPVSTITYGRASEMPANWAHSSYRVESPRAGSGSESVISALCLRRLFLDLVFWTDAQPNMTSGHGPEDAAEPAQASSLLTFWH